MTQLSMLTHRLQDGHSQITLTGELDIETAPRFRRTAADLIAAGHVHLVIDLDRVEFLDSTGLSVLVSALRSTQTHNGSLHLLCNRPSILRTLQTTGLDRVFDIYPTQDTPPTP